MKCKLCELFGLSSNKKVNAPELLKEFLKRSKEHPHGWGISWYIDRNMAGLVKEPVAAYESKIARFITEVVESDLIIAHIRKMSTGSYLSYNNTHPFVKTLRKRDLVFAHNGDVPEVKSDKKYKLKEHLPAGETDSEHAFCFMLERLSKIKNINLSVLAHMIWELAEDIGKLGKFNFLFSDGSYLLAYMNREGTLHYLQNSRRIIQIGNGSNGSENIMNVIISTEKLTDEKWVSMEPRTLYVFHKGLLLNEIKE
mgnify:CR=1 FL=1